MLEARPVVPRSACSWQPTWHISALNDAVYPHVTHSLSSSCSTILFSDRTAPGSVVTLRGLLQERVVQNGLGQALLEPSILPLKLFQAAGLVCPQAPVPEKISTRTLVSRSGLNYLSTESGQLRT